jgi:hypothetical protein
MNSKELAKDRQRSVFPRRTLMLAGAVLVLHLGVAYALDAAGLIESLLSPSGARILVVLPLAVLLYALRLVAYFVIPGLIVGSLLGWITERTKVVDS